MLGKVSKIGALKPNGELLYRFGTREEIKSLKLYGRIRKKLGLQVKDISNRQMSKYINLMNKEAAKWILENEEGFKFPKLGYIVVSKHKAVRLTVDIEAEKERINASDLNPVRKRILLERLKFPSELAGHNGMYKNKKYQEYTYRIMWFNKRNCITEKANVYRFKPARKFMLTMYNGLGKVNYQQRYFSDYYLPFYKCDE